MSLKQLKFVLRISTSDFLRQYVWFKSRLILDLISQNNFKWLLPWQWCPTERWLWVRIPVLKFTFTRCKHKKYSFPAGATLQCCGQCNDLIVIDCTFGWNIFGGPRFEPWAAGFASANASTALCQNIGKLGNWNFCLFWTLTVAFDQVHHFITLKKFPIRICFWTFPKIFLSSFREKQLHH